MTDYMISGVSKLKNKAEPILSVIPTVDLSMMVVTRVQRLDLDRLIVRANEKMINCTIKAVQALLQEEKEAYRLQELSLRHFKAHKMWLEKKQMNAASRI